MGSLHLLKTTRNLVSFHTHDHTRYYYLIDRRSNVGHVTEHRLLIEAQHWAATLDTL